MANSSKKIVRGVRFGSKTYTAGMEDELAKVLPSDEAKRLAGKGYLEGAWKAESMQAEAAPAIADQPGELSATKTAKKEK